MRIVYNTIIPFNGYLAINLFGILFVRKDVKKKLTDIDINHEAIHTEQMKELGYILFYILYVIEWIIKLFYHTNAYRNISFEREAYLFEEDSEYLKKRKKYHWLKLL